MRKRTKVRVSQILILQLSIVHFVDRGGDGKQTIAFSRKMPSELGV
jgi:hypothetical protein